MFKKLKECSIPCLILLFMGGHATAALGNISVFVDAGAEIGQAMLVDHSGACHAIVPTHVVKDSAFISAFGRGNQPAIGDALGVVSFGYDLSVMQIEGELANQCGPIFDSVSRNVDALLSADQRAQANTVNPDGTVTRIPLTIVDQSITYLRVAPTYSQDRLMKGMSGSLITVRGKPLGMLQSVEMETGVGKVIRIDRMMETVSPFFRAGGAMMSISESGAQGTESEDLGDNLALEIESWSAPAIDGEHRAQNLLSRDGEAGPWIGKDSRFPAQIVFSMGENRDTPIKTIRISGKGLEGNRALVRQIEVLIDPSGTGRWRSIKAVTLPAGGGSTKVPMAGRKAERIMIRLHNNYGDTSHIGLGRVSVEGS